MKYKVISGYSVEKNKTVYMVMYGFKRIKEYRYKFMARLDCKIRRVIR